MRFYPLNLAPYPTPPAPPRVAPHCESPPTAGLPLSPGVAACALLSSCAPPLSRCSCWVPCLAPRSAWLARLFPERSILGPPSQAPRKVRTLAPSLPKRSSTLLASVSIRLPSPQTCAAGLGARGPLSPRAPPQPHSCPGVPRDSVPLARAPLQVQNRRPTPRPNQAGCLSSLRWHAGTLLPWALRAPPPPRAPGGEPLRTRGSWGRSLPPCPTPHRRSSAEARGRRRAGHDPSNSGPALRNPAGPERARPALCPGHRGHRG